MKGSILKLSSLFLDNLSFPKCLWIPLIFWLIVPCLCLAKGSNQPDILYKVKYKETVKCDCLIIEGFFKGNDTGKMLLRIPHYAKDINISSDKKLSSNPKGADIYEIVTSPRENVYFDYQFCSDNQIRNIDYPMIEPDLFHFEAYQVLIMPESDIKTKKNIEFDFSEMPKTFNLASSFFIDQRKISLIQSIHDFRHSLFAGSLNSMKTFYINKNPVSVFINGEWSYFDKDITFYLKKLIETQRNFWNDYDFPHYVVYVIQERAPDNERHIRGIHRKNMMTLVIPNDHQNNKLSKVLASISHETFHAWLGSNIRLPFPQGDLQWFFEGITDYYGLYFSLKSGLISKREYVKLLNSLIAAYDGSPFYDISNERSRELFQLNSPINQLIQTRSHLVFANYLISDPDLTENKNKISDNSLDRSMREIYEKYGRKNEYINFFEIDRIFEKNFGITEWEKIKSHVLEGKKINFSPALFSKSAILVNKKVTVYSQEFDLNTFFNLKKINGLNPTSNAYKEGLRNGQEVISYRLSFNSHVVPSVILVKEGDQSKLIKFLPGKKTKLVPQYELFSDI